MILNGFQIDVKTTCFIDVLERFLNRRRKPLVPSMFVHGFKIEFENHLFLQDFWMVSKSTSKTLFHLCFEWFLDRRQKTTCFVEADGGFFIPGRSRDVARVGRLFVQAGIKSGGLFIFILFLFCFYFYFYSHFYFHFHFTFIFVSILHSFIFQFYFNFFEIFSCIST